MNEKKILLGIGIGTLAAAAVLGYGIYYSLGAISEKEADAQTKRDDIASVQEKVKKIVSLEDSVIVLRESVTALASVLPTQKEVEDFVTQIAASKGETGIKMRELSSKTSAGKQTLGKVFEKISYQIELKGSIWQFLEFLHRLESFKRFVLIPNLKVSPGQRDKALSEVLHVFKIDVETFTYNPGKVTSVEPIASYEKRREGLREEIDREIFTIEQPSAEFAGQRGRRDIFVDPRIPTNSGKEGELPIEQQTEIVGKLRTRVEELRVAGEKLKNSPSFIERFETRSFIDLKLPELDTDITKTVKEGVISYPLLVRTFQKEVKDAFEQLKNEIKSHVPDDPGMNLNELTALVVRVRELLQSGRLREAIDAAKPALEKAVVMDKDPERKVHVDELRRLDHDARIAEKFEQKKLIIGGIVLYEDRKAALVNGRTVEPGDSLDEDITIADIHEDGVTFVLDSVHITKKW
ncbi:MAG: type 4a pilus biogenesis protein PilO [Planctomycetota bacterium]